MSLMFYSLADRFCRDEKYPVIVKTLGPLYFLIEIGRFLLSTAKEVGRGIG